jgi:hypothetical protein
VRSIYQGSDQTKGLRANRRFITPMTLSTVPELFKKGLLPLHMDAKDVQARVFFCGTRRSFFREDMENLVQLDYINH